MFAIVSLLAQSSASPKWHLYKKQPQDGRRRYTTADQGSDQRVEVITHAALSLWNKPNDFHSGFEFREGANQHEELTGETIWVLNREATTFPTSMWYVRPDRMDPVPDPDDFLLGWMYTGPNGEQVPLQLDEVIIEKLPDPLDPFRGAGPVASILPNIEQQNYATQYQRNLFLNGADPGAIIQLDKKLTDREWDEFVDRWRESHQGIARAGRVGVLENGATWVSPAGTSNKDMEYGEPAAREPGRAPRGVADAQGDARHRRGREPGQRADRGGSVRVVDGHSAAGAAQGHAELQAAADVRPVGRRVSSSTMRTRRRTTVRKTTAS